MKERGDYMFGLHLFETAQYKIIKKFENRIQLRHYPTLYMATTTVKQNDKLTSGFNNVFDYISGNNIKKEKISMTTPVVTTLNETMQTTQFLVPSKYGSTPPTPTSNTVQITTIDEGEYLSIRFTGVWDKTIFHKKEKLLREFAKNNNFQLVSSPFILRYNPPITPSFLRKNEIMFKVVTYEKTA